MHDDFRHILKKANSETLVFQDVMRIIDTHYRFTPTPFATGFGTPALTENPCGENNGSLKVLAFARRLGFDSSTTLRLWGEHYRAVRSNPGGSEHPNIRAFMAGGWQGTRFQDDPLLLKGPG